MRRISPPAAAVCLLAFIAALLSAPLRAEVDHPEASIQYDQNLTLSALLDSTLERHPDSGVLQAVRVTAEAETRYGRYWIPEMVELEGFHLSDQQFDDIGVYENEVALSVPFWLPGEKKLNNTVFSRIYLCKSASKI